MRKPSFHAEPKSKVPVANALTHSLSLLLHVFTHSCSTFLPASITLAYKDVLKVLSMLLVAEVPSFREWALSFISVFTHFVLHSCAFWLLCAAARVTADVVTAVLLSQCDSWGENVAKLVMFSQRTGAAGTRQVKTDQLLDTRALQELIWYCSYNSPLW